MLLAGTWSVSSSAGSRDIDVVDGMGVLNFGLEAGRNRLLVSPWRPTALGDAIVSSTSFILPPPPMISSGPLPQAL